MTEPRSCRDDVALVIARLSDSASAIYLYDDLRQAERFSSLHIDGVLVLQCDEEGHVRVRRMEDHESREGFVWSAVAGAIATLFVPEAAPAEAASAGAGRYASLWSVERRAEIEDELSSVVVPGSSGIVCLAGTEALDGVADAMPWAQEIRTVLLDSETADTLKVIAAASAREHAGTI